MEYNTQNYWIFGLCPSFDVLETRKHDVSETDPVSGTLCFLVSKIQDDGKRPKPPSNPDFYLCVVSRAVSSL
jgi:hypothetical protein